jgi:hypothetical protein
MTEEQNDTAPSVASNSQEVVVLTVDYGNGVQKRFANIPCPQGMDVLEVLRAAGSINPGLIFEYDVTLFSDRVGREHGVIASIDGVKADEANRKWLVRINDRFETNEFSLSREGAMRAAEPLVNAGDVVELRLAASE